MSLRIKTGCFSVVEWSTYLTNRFKDTDCPQRIVYPEIEKKYIYSNNYRSLGLTIFAKKCRAYAPHLLSIM